MILTFNDFLNEGGRAVVGVRPIKQFEVNDTLEDVKKKIVPLLGLNWNEDILRIGSAGRKKDPNAESGDIDLGLIGYDIGDFNDVISKEYYGSVFNKGLKILSVPWPIMGNPKNGMVQIDFIPIMDKEWGQFIYNFPINKSKYKSAHRNWLFAAILSIFKIDPQEVDGDILAYTGYLMRLQSGLFKIRKSYIGKTSVLKHGQIIAEKPITKSPIAFVEMLFGKGTKLEDVATFESCWNIMSKPTYKFYKQLKEIKENYRSFLERIDLEIPSEINNEINNE